MPYRPADRRRREQQRRPARRQTCPGCGAAVERRGKDLLFDLGRFPQPPHHCDFGPIDELYEEEAPHEPN